MCVSALQLADQRLQPLEFKGRGVGVTQSTAVPPAGEESGCVAVSVALLLPERCDREVTIIFYFFMFLSEK